MTYTDVNQILWLLEHEDAISDIHICSDDFINYRKVGSIYELKEQAKVTFQEVQDMLKIMLSDYYKGWEKLINEKEIDFSFYSASGIPYRINTYYSLKKLSIAMRKIANKPMDLSELMYDDVADSVISNILNQKTGLFLVTGPTGSGKSTSLIAMIELLNQHRQEHIITIEDPIEFIFEPKSCHISQRELWSDTLSFAKAMKSAMRQDPDIIFVWEIRDPETADAALKLAETWHLVFSTLHTRNAADTIYRFVSLFPPGLQENAKDRLAAGLLGIQSQFLLKTSDQKGRVGLFELLVNSNAIRNDIRKNSWQQINSIIETSRQRGMISHTEYAKRLLAEWRIDRDQVDWLF